MTSAEWFVLASTIVWALASVFVLACTLVSWLERTTIVEPGRRHPPITYALRRVWFFLLSYTPEPPRPRGYIRLSGSLSDEDAAELKRRFQSGYARAAPIVLDTPTITHVRLYSDAAGGEPITPWVELRSAGDFVSEFAPVHEMTKRGETMCGADGGRWAQHGPEVTCAACKRICRANLQGVLEDHADHA